MYILSLPKLVRYTIGCHVGYKDLFELKSTCKKFYEMIEDEYFWKKKVLDFAPISLQNRLSEYKSFKDLGRSIYNQVVYFKNKKPLAGANHEFWHSDLDVVDIGWFSSHSAFYVYADGSFYAGGEMSKQRALKIRTCCLYLAHLDFNFNLWIGDKMIASDVESFASDNNRLAIISLGKLYTFQSYTHSTKHPTEYKFNYVADGVVDVVAGENHFLYLTNDGDVYGFGSNYCHQLAGSEEWIDEPIYIISGITKIRAGHSSSAFITKTNDLYVAGEIASRGENMTFKSPNVYDVEIGADMMAIITRDYDLFFVEKSEKYFVMSNIWQVSIYDSEHILARGFKNGEISNLLQTMNGMAKHSRASFDIIEEYLDYSNYRALFEKYSSDLYSLLHMLIQNKHYNPETLVLAIEFGLDINLIHPVFANDRALNDHKLWQKTPLTSAAESLNLNLLRCLLENNVNIQLRDGDGYNVYESILMGKFSPKNISDVESLLALLAKYDARPCIRSSIDFILRSSAEYTLCWNSHIIRKFLKNVEIDKIIG